MEDYVLQNTDCSGICGQECYNFIYLGNTAFSGICLLIACTMAGIQITRHLRHYNNPFFQNKILSLIFAGPFYGIMSYLTIVTEDHHGFWVVIRSFYDSLLLYFFFTLIVSYVAYEEGKINLDIMFKALHQKGQIPHGFPWNYCLKPISLASEERAKFFYMVVKNNVMQFFILNASCTFISMIVAISGGSAVWNIISNIILFVSICFCLYYLVLFYTALEVELKPYRPLLKFLAVKGIIFFTFWQGLAIEIFQKQILTLFNQCEIKSFNSTTIINSASCMLVCFEMIILTIMTAVAFSYKDFESSVQTPLRKHLLLNVVSQNIRDGFADLQEYDVMRSLSFRKRSQPDAVVAEKSFSTEYLDAEGKVVDANADADTKLYHEKIDVIPNSIKSTTSSVAGML